MRVDDLPHGADDAVEEDLAPLLAWVDALSGRDSSHLRVVGEALAQLGIGRPRELAKDVLADTWKGLRLDPQSAGDSACRSPRAQQRARVNRRRAELR